MEWGSPRPQFLLLNLGAPGLIDDMKHEGHRSDPQIKPWGSTLLDQGWV